MGTKNFYDAVLIGIGLPTLLAGGLLSKRGFRVLVVGQGQPLPSYEVDGVRLSRTPFTLTGADSPAISRVFSELALKPLVRRRVRPLSPAFQAVLPRHRLDFSADLETVTRDVEREFPAVRRAVDDFVRATQRSWESINRLVDRDLMWPPTGFFERREHARAALHSPFGKDDEARERPLSELADEHPFRVIVSSALTFEDGSVLGEGNAQRKLRLFAGALRGAELSEGGYQGLFDLLLESIRTHNGEVRLNDRIDRIGIKRGAVDHVRLSPSDEEVGCHFVLSGLPVSRMGRLLSDRTALDAMLDELGQPKPAFFRYTLNAVLEREALLEGMARNVLLIADPKNTRPEHTMRLELEPLEDGKRAVLSAELLLRPQAGDVQAEQLAGMRERALTSLDRLSPFFRRHLLWVDSPHDGRGVYDVRADEYLDAPDAFRRGPDTMPVLYTYARTSLHGSCALPVRTPVKRLLLCNEQVVPGLALEGTFLTAWSAARAVTRSLNRDWMNRGRWTKVEL
jgi:hypothetical protein